MIVPRRSVFFDRRRASGRLHVALLRELQLVQLFDVRHLPRLVIVRFQRSVQPQVDEESFFWVRFNPIVLITYWCFGSDKDLRAAVRLGSNVFLS